MINKVLKKYPFLNSPWFWLVLILVIGLFLRIYKLKEFYAFEHDQDLYSWIVKDIVANHHLRLIGQLTSIEGVFIGPLFYYLLVPFFVLLKMDPIAATIPAAILGLLTIFSIYFVLAKLFNSKVGLVGALLYSVSVQNVFWDRWVVPTQPTILWSVWFLFVVISISRGKWKVLPILGVLMGLIWNIHIALVPLLALVPVASLLSGKKPEIKPLFWGVLIFLISSLPLFVFELKNNFLQVHGLLNSFKFSASSIEGFSRVTKTFSAASDYIIGRLNGPVHIPVLISFGLLALLVLALFYKKLIPKRELLILLFWIWIVFLGQIISKRGISEYYFSNITVIPLLFLSVFLVWMTQLRKFNWLVWIGLGVFVVLNIFAILTLRVPNDKYPQKEQLVEYIKNDVNMNQYPCVGINYIAKYGTGVGFRYLLWWKGVNTIKASSEIPVYDIVVDFSGVDDSRLVNFGAYGVKKPSQQVMNAALCGDPERQLLPPLGYTD